MCVKGVKYFSESAARGKEFFLSLLGYNFNGLFLLLHIHRQQREFSIKNERRSGENQTGQGRDGKKARTNGLAGRQHSRSTYESPKQSKRYHTFTGKL